VLNQALRHQDVWENGGIAPRVINLGTRWRCIQEAGLGAVVAMRRVSAVCMTVS
jgi:hypothetical protein